MAGSLSATVRMAAEQQQSRERQRAEQQRRLAEQRENETVQARDQLQTVVEFQSSMLGQIDAETMGRSIFDDLCERIRESLEANETLGKDIDAALVSFNELVRGVNATDLALNVIDKQVLGPHADVRFALGRSSGSIIGGHQHWTGLERRIQK